MREKIIKVLAYLFVKYIITVLLVGLSFLVLNVAGFEKGLFFMLGIILVEINYKK